MIHYAHVKDCHYDFFSAGILLSTLKNKKMMDNHSLKQKNQQNRPVIPHEIREFDRASKVDLDNAGTGDFTFIITSHTANLYNRFTPPRGQIRCSIDGQTNDLHHRIP